MIYPIANKTLRRDCIKQGKCPECGSELDTGFECNNQACQFDAAPEVAELATIILLVSERADPNLILTRLRSFVAAEKEAYEKAMADLRTAVARESREIEQTLGKALGYPWYKDDPKNFPNATEANGVCVGEHVPASLAVEAARKIADLTRERDEARAMQRGAEQAFDVADKLACREKERAEKAEAEAAAMQDAWTDTNKCLGIDIRCEGDDAARAFNKLAGIMDAPSTAGRNLLARMERMRTALSEALVCARASLRVELRDLPWPAGSKEARWEAALTDKEPTP